MAEPANGSWERLRQLNPEACKAPANEKWDVEILSLLGLLKPEMTPRDVNQTYVALDVVENLLPPAVPGDDHYSDRKLAAVKALSQGQRLRIRDRWLGVLEFQKKEINGTTTGVVEGS